MVTGTPEPGSTLGRAALIAGLGILTMVFAAPFAELYVFPGLIVRGDVEATIRNFQGQRILFLAGLFAYLITFICDVLVAWALYLLLAPFNKAVSLLTAWCRLVYTIIAIVGLLKLVTAYRLAVTPDYADWFGRDQLHAQVQMLLSAFRYEWSLGFVFFGIYLFLLGALVYRSGYIPRILGVLLAISGVAYPIYYLRPYFLPEANLDFLMITFFSEVIFMIWLLIRGRKIEEPILRTQGAQQSESSVE